MYHRVFKKIKEHMGKGDNMFFLWGESKYIYDHFYTTKGKSGKLLPLRESLIETFKEGGHVDKTLQIYYDDGKIHFKSSVSLGKDVSVEDELGEFEGSNKQLNEEVFNDPVALINTIKEINTKDLKKGKWLVVFDDFNQIAKTYRGFDSQEIGRFFSEVVLNWRKIPNNFYIFIIRDKGLGWLEDFGITDKEAIEVLEPDVHELARAMHYVAKKHGKRLSLPLTTASKYVEDPRPLKVIIKEFEDMLKNMEDEEIKDYGREEELDFEDIRLEKETKEEIRSIFDKFKDGKSVTNGIILYGPPGTGKTTIARALAKQAGSFFLKTSASDFKGEFVGQSGQNTRRIFEKLRNNKPAVLFIDEADAILGHRGNRLASDNYSNDIVNEFLANVDGLKSDREIFVVVATNYLDRLDDAIRSRFKEIKIGLPKGHVLKEIVVDYLGKEFEQDYDLFYGLSGRDISHLGKEWNSKLISSKEKLIERIIESRLSGLGYYTPKHNFSEVCGYKEQKTRVTKLFERGIRRFVVSGATKVGKSFFIEAMAGELGLAIVSALPDHREKLHGIEDKIMFFQSLNAFQRDLIDRFPDVAMTIEVRNAEEETLEELKMLGFMEINLSPDDDTIKEFVHKRFGKELSEEDVRKLKGKSFYYIDNYVKAGGE